MDYRKLKNRETNLCISLFLMMGCTPQISSDLQYLHLFVWSVEYKLDR